jgi:aspartyl-tRNA(Asn)/glutamyl-tRNA(Gln) amidotransferase subunit A
MPDALEPEIRQLCQRAVDRLRDQGAEILDVSLPNTHLAIPAYYVIAPAEASSNLARFDGVRFGHRAEGPTSPRDMYERSRSEGFGVEVKRRIMLGTYALSAGYYDAYYGSAQRARARIAADFRDAFRTVDVLFTPTSPTVAFGLGERVQDPVQMYLSDVFTVTANLAGIPAMSLPIGRSRGLPVGGQIMAPRWGEVSMLRAAGALEAALAEEGT